MSSNTPSPELGTVLLSSRFRPVYAVNILLTGVVFLLLALDGIFFHLVVPDGEGSILQAALGVVLGIGILATYQGASQLARPQVLTEATDRGLVLHRPGGARGAGDRFLVPWPRIKSLEYKVHALPTGIRRARMETIAVSLDATGGFRVPEGFSQLLKPLPGCDPDAVYVDAGSGVPGGKELWRQLDDLRRRHLDGVRGSHPR